MTHSRANIVPLPHISAALISHGACAIKLGFTPVECSLPCPMYFRPAAPFANGRMG